MSWFGRLTLALTGLLAGLSYAGSDCSLARDEISRDACYKANADEHWRNSRDYQRIQFSSPYGALRNTGLNV